MCDSYQQKCPNEYKLEFDVATHKFDASYRYDNYTKSGISPVSELMSWYGEIKKWFNRIGGLSMVAKKGKRKIEYEGNIFYWFVRADDNGRLRIHILSEDKKINLEYPPFDSEVPVTPSYIRRLLDNYFMKV